MSKVITFFKNNWKSIALSVVSLLVLFVVTYSIVVNSRRTASLQAQLDEFRKIHEEELKKLDLIREEERRLLFENDKKREEELRKLAKEYEESFRKLEESKVNRAKQIVTEHGENPNKLAEILSKVTGLPVK